MPFAKADAAVMPGLRAEALMLLAAASVAGPDDRDERLRFLARDGIDHERLIRLASHNRVATLLYDGLRSAAPANVPPAFMRRLEELFQRTALRNMFLTRELREIVALLRADGIVALPYKGPVLAQALYGHPALRQFFDLDILVRAKDVIRAKDLLIARGYRPEKSLSPRQEQRLLSTDCEYNLDGKGGRSHVEIHWRVLPEPLAAARGADRLWERALPVDIGGAPALTLPPEELFLVLALHGGGKHRWSRLQWVADLARLIDRYPGLDYAALAGETRAVGCEEDVLAGVHLACTLLGAAPPGAISSCIPPGRALAARSLAALARARLFRDDFGLPGFREWRAYMRADEAAGSSGAAGSVGEGDLAVYLRAVARPEFRDRRGAGRGVSLAGFSSMYRAFRLVCRHGAGLAGRLR